MKRIAPKKIGYDFDEKARYREELWGFIKEYYSPKLYDKKIMIMPSIEGIEIKKALSIGILEENITIVDQNPAIVATLKRKYKKINTRGVDFFNACIRESIKGNRFDVVNFDGCSNINKKFYLTMRNITKTKIVKDRGFLFFTLLYGREIKGELNERSENFCDKELFLGFTEGIKKRRMELDSILSKTDKIRFRKVVECLGFEKNDGPGNYAFARYFYPNVDISGGEYDTYISVDDNRIISKYGKYRSISGQSIIWGGVQMLDWSDTKTIEFVRECQESFRLYKLRNGWLT